MEFKEFFSMMKNRISDGADVPYFFRDLIAMITEVTEDEWATPKDPSTKLTKENTLRTYAKRGISKKFAQSIVYKLSPEMFIESLSARPSAALKLLADDYKSYDATATQNNIAVKLSDCFVDIIRRAAGLVVSSELERQKMMQLAYELKYKYGEYLRDETDNICAFPGCGKLLSVTDNGHIAYTYEVALIDKKKEPKINNLLALCPMCHATYSIDENKKLCKELQGIKKILTAHKQSMRLLDGMPLEKEIIGVISKIKNLKEKDLLDPSLDPKNIREKLNPDDNLALFNTVKGYASHSAGLLLPGLPDRRLRRTGIFSLQEAKANADAILRQRIEWILQEIEDTLNDRMKEFNDSLFATKKKPPHVHFNAYNSYRFETPDNTGTGSNFKGMIVYDLAVLFTTALPAIAHDSLLFKNLGKDIEDGIIRIYNSTKKQIFIAYDKQGDCRPETQEILEKNCILRLSTNNCELYGRSWDTEE